MPAFNSENFIQESIESVLSQTYKNFELIVIDDGSTDRTIDIINKFKDKRIRLFKNISNKGIVYSLNRAIKNSRGDFIARLDSDDICLSHRLETQLEYLEKNNLDMIGSGINVFINQKSYKKIYYPKAKYISNYVKFGCPFAHPTVFGKSSVFKENNYISSTNSEDLLLWSFLILKKFKLDNIREPLLFYRIHENNLSGFQNKSFAQLIYYLNQKNRLLNYLDQIKNDFEDELYHYIIKVEKINYWDNFWLNNYKEIMTRKISIRNQIKKGPNCYSKAKILTYELKNILETKNYTNLFIVFPYLLLNLKNMVLFYFLMKRRFWILNILNY